MCGKISPASIRCHRYKRGLKQGCESDILKLISGDYLSICKAGVGDLKFEFPGGELILASCPSAR